MTNFSRRHILATGGSAFLTSVVARLDRAYADDRGLRDLHGWDSRFGSADGARGTSVDRWNELAGNRLPGLDDLLAGEAGVYGVMVVDQRGLLRYSRNPGLPFISASLYKLLLCTEILRQIEDRELSVNDRLFLDGSYFIESQMPDGAYGYDAIGMEIAVHEALWATICVSSNVAAISLLSLTSPETMNALGTSLGMTSTTFASDLPSLDFWPPQSAESDADLLAATALIERQSWDWQINLTSPADMTRFTQHVMQGTLLSPFISSVMRGLLFDQQINDRMPALLPASTRAAHKTGNLTSIVHDAGSIMTSSGPVLLSMLSQAVPDEHHATRLLQLIAAMVYAELERA